MAGKIKINRAPVLTLWAAVVAEQLGYPWDTSLTLGKAVAGMNAQSKGKRLGIYADDDSRKDQDEKKEGEKTPLADLEQRRAIELLGRLVTAQETSGGLRAVEDGHPMDPRGVERYLAGKFKDSLEEARQAMRELAGSLEPRELERRAFGLYEKFRPEVPEGVRGWGAMGELDLEKIEGLRRV